MPSQKCVAIDGASGSSSQCGNFGTGITKRTCRTCQQHSSCLACQNDPTSCFWCPGEQLCLPHDSGDTCKGMATLPSRCLDCSLYTGSCTTCQAQPDCDWCLTTNACITNTAPCAQKAETCREQCAQAFTCEGCLKMLDCRWDGGVCGQRGVGQPHQIRCPGYQTGFDAASFVGGIFLVLGLALVGAVIYFVVQWYQRAHGTHSSLSVQ